MKVTDAEIKEAYQDAKADARFAKDLGCAVSYKLEKIKCVALGRWLMERVEKKAKQEASK